MRKSRYNEQQMVKILREADAAPVVEVAKKYGISDQTIYIWPKRKAQSKPFATTSPKSQPVRTTGWP